MTLVEYGLNQPIGICRTEHVNSHLISVRVNERLEEQQSNNNNKKIAYLVDLQTIHIMDLSANSLVASINHDSRIDWLELNDHATKLLFRDKR